MPTSSVVPVLDAEMLRSLPLFSTLDAEERAAIAAMGRIEEHPGGSRLFVEGDASEDIFIVLSGRVTLCTRLRGGRESCFLSLREGELLGWSALLSRPRVATARVVEDSRVARIPASRLLELCESDHRVGYTLMSQAFEEVADRLVSTRLQLLDVFDNPGS